MSQKLQNTPLPYDHMANAIRILAMDAVEKAQSGHPGMPMGMADVATVLYTQFLKFDAEVPTWPDRDRFILSAGHGSMLLYALNYLTGYKGMTLESLQNFRQFGSHTAGHPERDVPLGIETTTGPLGQGLANAVGMALAERILNAEFGDAVVDHHTYVIAGDGCLMEGISQEAISLAGHLQLHKLIVFFDDNHITIDGGTELSTSEDTLMRFKACQWHVQAIDGHDKNAISQAIAKAQASPSPSLIACRTTIGYGAPTKAGTAAAHGSPLGASEIQAVRERLGWSYPPFEIPQNLLDLWREVGKRGQAQRQAWEQEVQKLSLSQRQEWHRRLNRDLPSKWQDAFHNVIEEFVTKAPEKATRQLSHTVLTAATQVIPELIGGSADLTESNKTHVSAMIPITSKNYGGRYIHYGIREHAMTAAMNGLCAHGGLIPYGGTFLTFTDYCRPALRLSALMHQPVIYVMTHDSIGLGEDGPTHQPIEHLASLRAIPNLNVFRPADGIEVAQCWMLALAEKSTPSVLALTRQNVPTLHKQVPQDNLCARGAYVLYEPTKSRQATLLATGSEVHIALEAAQELEKQGIATAVVSMPCWRLFDQQDRIYQKEVLGPAKGRIAIEAASPFGWEKYIGDQGSCLGISTFGMSAPAAELYKHFQLTSQHIVATVLNTFKKEVKI